MEYVPQSVSINGLDEYNYPEFRSRLIELYLHAFTTGEYARFILPETAEVTLDNLLRVGSSSMAFVGGRLVGLLAAFPLKKDPDFPADAGMAIPVDRAVYIADLMVHDDYRGRGIASLMLNRHLQKASENYSHAVIRVWEENKPALELYRKLGFTMIAKISQRKLTGDGGEFEMKKLYLAKELE